MDSSLFEKYNKPKTKAPPHALSACTDEIEKNGLYTKGYVRGYWLKMLSKYQKRKNIDATQVYNQLLGILKNIQEMDKKYPKGATLTNILLKK